MEKAPEVLQALKLSAMDSTVWHQEDLALSSWMGVLGPAQFAAAVSRDTLLPNASEIEGRLSLQTLLAFHHPGQIKVDVPPPS